MSENMREVSVVEKYSPSIVMVISIVAMGSLNALVKKALDVGVNHMVVAAYGLAISAFILAPVAYIWERKTRPQLTFRLMVDHFFSGLLGFCPLKTNCNLLDFLLSSISNFFLYVTVIIFYVQLRISFKHHITTKLKLLVLFLIYCRVKFGSGSLMQFFFLLGLSDTSATVSCAMASMLPAITFTLALIFRTENVKNLKTKAGMLKVTGTLICICGALFLTFYKGPQISNSHSYRAAAHNDNNAKNWLIGCLYLTVGTVLLSLWMFFQGTLSNKYPCKYTSTCLMSVFAAIQCALLSLYKRRDVNDWVIADKFVIFVIIYAGVVGLAMSTVATTWGIKKLGAVFASAFLPIAVISATLLDLLILHTPLYLGSVIGSLVTITGLYLFLWGKKFLGKKK